MATFRIMREAGPMARDRRRRDRYAYAGTPMPKRVAVIEAPTQADALSAFARAEEARSSHVRGWHVTDGIAHRWGNDTTARLVVTLVNGVSVHDVVYLAWRKEDA